VVIAGEPFDVDLTTTAADGKPRAAKRSRRFACREAQAQPHPHPAAMAASRNPRPPRRSRTPKLDAKTDAATGKASSPSSSKKAADVSAAVTGTDRFGQPITGEREVEVSDNDDANKLRLFADEATLKVGQDAKVRLHSRLDKGLALLTYEGETILRYQIVDLRGITTTSPSRSGTTCSRTSASPWP
jgi:hypothetical protein